MTDTPTVSEPQSEDQDDPALFRQRRTSISDIRETYATQADRMARLSWLNRLFTGRYRRDLFGRAEGRVLDVACGTGLNRRYLPDSVEYVGVDISPEMLANARERNGDGATFREMDAGELAFTDDSFDTAVSSLSTCTFPDPVAALEEMARVCRPGGRVLLLEHGRSDVAPLARFQDWRADAHFRKHACRWNQRPLRNVAEAGLSVTETTTALFGVLTAIEARPE
ncbi:MAG: class I SAM-dependent methyltransferase [Haloarculaceae archaeon]